MREPTQRSVADYSSTHGCSEYTARRALLGDALRFRLKYADIDLDVADILGVLIDDLFPNPHNPET